VADLTRETLAVWRRDADQYPCGNCGQDDRILALLDALDDERTARQQAEYLSGSLTLGQCDLADALAAEKVEAERLRNRAGLHQRDANRLAQALADEKARADKAEQESRQRKIMQNEQARLIESLHKHADEIATQRNGYVWRVAELEAGITRLADEWIAQDDTTRWGDHTKSRCGHELRALIEKAGDQCVHGGKHVYVTRSHMGDAWPECEKCGIASPKEDQ
jgi:hypothetical protein